MRISDWSSDVCSSDLPHRLLADLGTRDHARYRFLPHLHRRQLRRPDEGGAKGRGGEDEQGKTESEGGGSETGENHDSGKGKEAALLFVTPDLIRGPAFPRRCGWAENQKQLPKATHPARKNGRAQG